MRVTLSEAEIRKAVDGVGTWYHAIHLGGVVTPGAYDLRHLVGEYALPRDMTGWKVIDIGTSNGFFAFEFERRGADVLAVDLPSWVDHDYPGWFRQLHGPRLTARELESINRNELHGGFDVAHRALGSSVRKITSRVYDLRDHVPKGSMRFAFLGSLLIHLRDPVAALEVAHDLLRDRGLAIVATSIHNDPGDQPSAVFIGDPEVCSWWMPNMPGLIRMCETAGFTKVTPRSTFEVVSKEGVASTIGVVQCQKLPR